MLVNNQIALTIKRFRIWSFIPSTGIDCFVILEDRTSHSELADTWRDIQILDGGDRSCRCGILHGFPVVTGILNNEVEKTGVYGKSELMIPSEGNAAGGPVHDSQIRQLPRL